MPEASLDDDIEISATYNATKKIYYQQIEQLKKDFEDEEERLKENHENGMKNVSLKIDEARGIISTIKKKDELFSDDVIRVCVERNCFDLSNHQV